MIRITIDNKTYSVPEGTPVIEAARMSGASIPSMCYRKEKEHLTSCMVCLVKDRTSGKLFPSCSVTATEGMDVITGDEEVKESRKMALELLLSEHVGDCIAPCQVTCPAHMNIPLMNRLLAEGRFEEALEVVRRDIALPSVFGRICPAPCEGACRRKSVDEAVSICLLKRAAGDHDNITDSPWKPQMRSGNGKKVSIIGAGPAGLAVAHYLRIRGYHCEVYDRRELPGGTLWSEVESGKLPVGLLKREVGIIASMGVVFHSGVSVDMRLFSELSASSDALVIAAGSSGVGQWDLSTGEKGEAGGVVNYRVGETSVFVTGSALKSSKLAIRALGQGKEAAFSVDQFLQGVEVTGEPSVFNSRFGKLLPEEIGEYLRESVPGNRIEPDDLLVGLNREQVMLEAARCMHCDCRDLENCKLREFSNSYGAQQKRFWPVNRKMVTKVMQHAEVVYEPAKCIKCGICVQITVEHRETFGLSFIGRGFDVVVGVPLDESIENGLQKVAIEVADACPTGAICRLRMEDFRPAKK